jgi:hypothetical protein
MSENRITPEDVSNEVGNILSVKKQRNILLIVLLLLVFSAWFGLNRFSNIKTDLAISEQNNRALSDSVRYEKTKSGKLEAVKNILIADKKDLADLNAELAKELKEEKGKVKEIYKFITIIKHDTIYIPTYLIKYADGSNGLIWQHDTIYNKDNERHLAGVSRFKVDSLGTITPMGTLITRDDIMFSLVTGLKENGDNIEIFIRSDYPGFKALKIDGAIIDPKKHPVVKKFTKQKRFGIGPYVGIGLGINTIPNTNVGVGLQMGIGIHYDIIKF